MTSDIKDLLECLLTFAERAGKLAHAIREHPTLFSLLVEEKGENEKNQKFTQDFKTLADVLIQESLRYYISEKFPSLGEYVHGEENAIFTNTLGHKITVKVCESEQETTELLAKVLDGNKEASAVLANIVHQEMERKIEDDLISRIPSIPIDNIGIWIDPIDSTAEYVKGLTGKSQHGIFEYGLPCVTVLIGVFDRSSGLPIIGVINHPFYSFDDISSSWKSRILWGIHNNECKINNLNSPHEHRSRPIIVLSSTDEMAISNKLNEKFEIVFAAGAGYKCMVVFLGFADAYYYSKSSTFKWDTNAPHAILRSSGGGILTLEHFNKHKSFGGISEDEMTSMQIRYHEPSTSSDPGFKWANIDGFVCYSSTEILDKISDCLQ